MTVCSCHVTYVFQSESTLYRCLNVKELLTRSRREIWSLSDCNCTRTKWFWVGVQLQSLKKFHFKIYYEMLNLPQVFFQIYNYYRPFDFIFKNWLSFNSAHKCLFKIYTRSIELGVGIVRGFFCFVFLVTLFRVGFFIRSLPYASQFSPTWNLGSLLGLS